MLKRDSDDYGEQEPFTLCWSWQADGIKMAVNIGGDRSCNGKKNNTNDEDIVSRALPVATLRLALTTLFPRGIVDQSPSTFSWNSIQPL